MTKIEEIPALIQVNIVSKPFSERISFVKERILKPNAPRPRTRKTLASHIAAMFLKAISEADITGIIEGLFNDGSIRENGKRLVYSDESP